MKPARFLLILVLLSSPVFGQQTQPTPPAVDDGAAVKISTELVQIDAVVTDEQGNQITNLTINDFELLQDGKPQSITNFFYVNAETRRPRPPSVSRETGKNDVLPPPSIVSGAAESGRLITFVVDDGNCLLTRGGMKAARDGLEKFITEQMQPDDRVAIYQTRRGSSLLQQYTSDKARLLSLVGKIRWYPPAGICPLTGDDYEQSRNEGNLKKEGAKTFETERDQKRREASNDFNRDRQTSGLIGVMRYAINGLRRVGGRKVMFLLSESLPISNGKSTLFNSFYDVRDLAELANRSSVVINPIDIRGLNTPMAQAIDDFDLKKDDIFVVERTITGRQLSDDSRQSGLSYAASETGGKFYRNSNNLEYPIQEALKLEKGYYLIGYQPEEETFKGKKFHKIEIKVKRSNLRVSSRSGFDGVVDSEIRPKARTGDSELYDAIIAPLPNAGLNLQVTAFFANTAAEGSFVRTLLHIDGKQIAFTDEADNTKKAVFDVIAVTLNEKNEAVDEFNRTHTIRFPAANLPEIQQNGLVYSIDVPVKKAGSYSFRIAVRDAASRLLGSAGQQIDVPDMKKNEFLLSGLTMGEVSVKDGKPLPPSIEKVENAFTAVTSSAVPAIRRFRPGTIIGYSYKIYNAQPDKATQQPKLMLQTRLYQDGQPITDGAPQPLQLDKQSDPARINDYGYMRLPANAANGNYALQITVKDLQTNEISSQWIDFEVAR